MPPSIQIGRKVPSVSRSAHRAFGILFGQERRSTATNSKTTRGEKATLTGAGAFRRPLLTQALVGPTCSARLAPTAFGRGFLVLGREPTPRGNQSCVVRL